jgi:hypothetical protein
MKYVWARADIRFRSKATEMADMAGGPRGANSGSRSFYSITSSARPMILTGRLAGARAIQTRGAYS